MRKSSGGVLFRVVASGAAITVAFASAFLVGTWVGSLRSVVGDDPGLRSSALVGVEGDTVLAEPAATSAGEVNLLPTDNYRLEESVFSAVVKSSIEHLTVRAGPRSSADVVAEFKIEPDYPLNLLATGRASDETDWIEVFLPIRPNGSTGWVPRTEVSLSRNPYRVLIDREARELKVLRSGEEILRTEAAIGKSDTPTPPGRFYTLELFEIVEASGPYGPYAYSLSGFSEVLMNFDGGPGTLGIHGTNNPNSIGQDVSHGCVRIPNEVISDLATFLPLGTPVDIV